MITNSGFTDSEITATFILGSERVGDMVEIQTAYDGVKKGIIRSMNLTVYGDIVADVVIREVL